MLVALSYTKKYISEMKSLAMLNFKNISPNADFYSKLDILNKNVLYVTHMSDKILKILKRLDNDNHLQEQVDKYFLEEETSPQTESVEQIGSSTS